MTVATDHATLSLSFFRQSFLVTDVGWRRNSCFVGEISDGSRLFISEGLDRRGARRGKGPVVKREWRGGGKIA